jgi:hypothetical protein
LVLYVDGWSEVETEPDLEDAIARAESIIGADPDLPGGYEIWSKDEHDRLCTLLHKVECECVTYATPSSGGDGYGGNYRDNSQCPIHG